MDIVESVRPLAAILTALIGACLIMLAGRRPNLHELALPRHKAILTAIESRDALGARQATLVQLEDARMALDVVLSQG